MVLHSRNRHSRHNRALYYPGDEFGCGGQSNGQTIKCDSKPCQVTESWRGHSARHWCDSLEATPSRAMIKPSAVNSRHFSIERLKTSSVTSSPRQVW
jgi:hypothetical protein